MNAPAIAIIPLDISDTALSAELRDLQTAAYRVEASLIGFEGIPQIGESHESLLSSPARFYGCRLEGRLAGAIALEHADSGAKDISRLVVHPDFFRRGLASALLDYVLSLYPEAPFEVSTGSANLPAVQLYLRFGFQETGRIEIAPGIFLTLFRRNLQN